SVRIDGVKRSEGTASSRSFWLNPGAHTVQIDHRDGRQQQRRIDVQSGQTHALTLRLPSRRTRLTVRGPKADTALQVVGVTSGRGRIEVDVPPGAYRVRAPDIDEERLVTVVEGQPMGVAFTEPSSSGTLWIWIGVATVVVAASITAAVVVNQRVRPDEDPVWGRISEGH
ncbi:MAG: hypothetical protein AAFN74_18840, partial [Myxococcota bacterium]